MLILRKKYFDLIRVYSLTEVVAKGLNWLIMIILPRIISIDVFGYIALLVAFENLILPISQVGQHVTVLRFFDRFRKHKELFFLSIRNVFVQWNLIVIPAILLITFLIYCSAPFLIVTLSIPFLAIREIILNYLRVEEKKKTYFQVRVSFQAIKFILIIVFAYTIPQSNYIYPLGLSIAILVNIFQITVLIKSDITLSTIYPSKPQLTKQFFLFGFPIIFHAFSNALSMFINRYFIEFFIDKSAVGLFSFAYSFSFSLFFLLYIGGLVFQPLLYKSKTVNDKSERMLTLYTNSIFIFICMASLVLWFLFPYILSNYSAEYLESSDSFKILLFSILIVPFYHQGNYRLTLKNKTKILPLASGVAALINAILNFLLIPDYGIIGAAYSTLASSLILMTLTNLYSIRFGTLKNRLSIILIISISILIYSNKLDLKYIPLGILLLMTASFIEILKIRRSR